MQAKLRCFTLASSALLCAAVSHPQASPAFALHNDDRVVFYGDSITALRYYTADVEEFTLTRYPALRLEFFNAGVAGDTVYGGMAGDTATRLARGVYPYKPTMVTVMLGMNDTGYVPFDQPIFDTFQSGYKVLLSSISTALPQARLTLIAETPYDEITHGTQFPGLSTTVQRYGNFVEQQARQRGDIFANFNRALDDSLHSTMKQNPDYAALFIPDRIHPSEIASWIMAEALMSAWNASPEVSFQKLDAVGATVLTTRNAEVSNLQKTSTGLSWTALEHALPLPFSLDDPLIQFALKATSLASQDQETLQVVGLPTRQYSLQIDDKPVADLSSGELSAGVNLALLRTPMLDQAGGLHWLEHRKVAIDTTRYVLESEEPTTPGAADAIKSLRAAMHSLTEQQHRKAQPTAHRFCLIAKEDVPVAKADASK